MNSKYFQTEEFRSNLAYYESKMQNGESVYLDEDDFADIADYYMSEDRSEDAMIAADMGLLAHQGSEGLLTVKSSVYIFQRELELASSIVDKLDSDNSDVYYQKCQLKYALDMDSAEADRMFRRWMKMDNGQSPSEQMRREAYVHVISSFVELRGMDDETGERVYDVELTRRWVEEYIEKFQPLGSYDEDVQIVDICREYGITDLAVKGLVQVLDERPYLPRGWSHLALMYYTLEMYDNANEACDFALAIDPEDMETIVTKGHVLYELGDKEGCIPYFEDYLAKGGRVLHVLPLVDALFSSEINGIATLRKLVRLLSALYNEEELDNPFMSRNEKMAINYMFCDIGNVLFRNKKYKRAMVFYLKALQFDSTNYDTYFMMGSICAMTGSPENAQMLFMEGLEYSEDKVGYCIDMVVAYVLGGLYDCAVEVLDSIDSPDNGDCFASSTTPARAFVDLAVGDKEQFLLDFRKALTINKDMTQSLFVSIMPEGMPVDEWYDYSEKEFYTLQKKI